MEKGGISEAARRAGVSASTIRNWRERGLLRSELTPWCYHVYDLAEVSRVAAWRASVDREVAKLRKPPHELRREREKRGTFSEVGV